MYSALTYIEMSKEAAQADIYKQHKVSFLTSGERSATERTASPPFRQPVSHLGRAEAGTGGAHHQTTGR